MAIKLIAIDLDGTLLNSHHQISPAVRQAVMAANMLGIKVVLATGRPFSGTQPYLTELGLTQPEHYCICNNGSTIHHAGSGKHMIETLLSFNDYLQFELLSRQLGIHLHVLDFNTMYTADRHIGHYTVRESFLSHIPLQYCPANEMDPELRFTKFMLTATPEKLSQAIEQIPETFYQQYTLMKSSDYLLEVINKQANKGIAVQYIAQYLQITPDQVMCIGDQANDLAMLKFAGIGVAMGNAPIEVKQVAQFVTSSNLDDGVAEAINKFVINQM